MIDEFVKKVVESISSRDIPVLILGLIIGEVVGNIVEYEKRPAILSTMAPSEFAMVFAGLALLIWWLVVVPLLGRNERRRAALEQDAGVEQDDSLEESVDPVDNQISMATEFLAKLTDDIAAYQAGPPLRPSPRYSGGRIDGARPDELLEPVRNSLAAELELSAEKNLDITHFNKSYDNAVTEWRNVRRVFGPPKKSIRSEEATRTARRYWELEDN